LYVGVGVGDGFDALEGDAQGEEVFCEEGGVGVGSLGGVWGVGYIWSVAVAGGGGVGGERAIYLAIEYLISYD